MISVIIPIYNAEKWLRRCLDSIVRQTIFCKLEVILIDDGSVDSSSHIIDEYVSRYSSFKALHIENQGVSNARNQGIDIAIGEYLAFIDADDYIDNDYFETLLNGNVDEADIVCSGFIAEYSGHSVNRCVGKQYRFDQEQAIEEFLKGSLIDWNIWNKLFKKSKIKGVYFDSRFCIAEDKYFLFQCLKRVHSVQVLDNCKYHYIMNETSACHEGFSSKKLDSLIVAELISKEIGEYYPSKHKLAKSMEMDVVCRVYGEMYSCNITEEYKSVFNRLKKNIRQYSIAEKKKYSNKKNFGAFLAARIHPKLYNFLKNDMKLQYKN